MTKMNHGMVAVLISMTVGCVTAPFDYTTYTSGNTDRYITFSGYTSTPAQTVTLQAHHNGTWTTFATSKTSTSVDYAGPWSDIQDLYSWTSTTQIGSGGALWDEGDTVEVRVLGGSSVLYGFNDSGEIGCVIGENGTLLDAYDDCVDARISTLHLVDIN